MDYIALAHNVMVTPHYFCEVGLMHGLYRAMTEWKPCTKSNDLGYTVPSHSDGFFVSYYECSLSNGIYLALKYLWYYN